MVVVVVCVVGERLVDVVVEVVVGHLVVDVVLVVSVEAVVVVVVGVVVEVVFWKSGCRCSICS